MVTWCWVSVILCRSSSPGSQFSRVKSILYTIYYTLFGWKENKMSLQYYNDSLSSMGVVILVLHGSLPFCRSSQPTGWIDDYSFSLKIGCNFHSAYMCLYSFEKYFAACIYLSLYYIGVTFFHSVDTVYLCVWKTIRSLTFDKKVNYVFTVLLLWLEPCMSCKPLCSSDLQMLLCYYFFLSIS